LLLNSRYYPTPNSFYILISLDASLFLKIHSCFTCNVYRCMNSDLVNFIEIVPFLDIEKSNLYTRRFNSKSKNIRLLEKGFVVAACFSPERSSVTFNWPSAHRNYSKSVHFVIFNLALYKAEF